MIGETKSIQIKDEEGVEKDYDIKKCGVSKAMELQGIFSYLVKKSKVNQDSDTDDISFLTDLQCGLDEYSIKIIKKIVIDLCVAPNLDDESFENLGINTVLGLFINIYLFNLASGQKKKGS